MTETKLCKPCGTVKPRSEFSKRTSGGFTNAYCKKCMSKRTMAWAKKNKAKAAKYQQTYNRKHKDQINEKWRKRYATDKVFREKQRAHKRRLYHKNKK